MARSTPSIVAALALAALPACEVIQTIQPVPVAEYRLWDDAAGAVEDPDLAQLCTEYWNWSLRQDPIWATWVGDPRFLGDLPQLSERSRDKDLEELDLFLERALRIMPAYLVADDRKVHDFVVGRLQAGRSRLEHATPWAVDPIEGPLTRLLNVAAVQPVQTSRERDALLSRWRAVPGFFREASMNLRRGALEGFISNETAFHKHIESIDAFLATPPMDGTLIEVATAGGRWVDLPSDGNLARVAHDEMGDTRHQRILGRINLHLTDPERVARGTRVLIPAPDDPLEPKERGEFLYAVLTTVEGEIYPALATYRQILGDLVISARSDDEPGLVHLRGGDATYAAMIAYHTSLPPEECDATAIHEFGLSEVARIRAELSMVGQRVFDTRDVTAIQSHLRSDPNMHFETSAQVKAKAEESLSRARGALDGFFGMRPQARCVVREIPAHQAENSTVAYYQSPEAGGGRPGTYYVNVSDPTTRTRYEAEVLAYHEAIPGHHLQLAIAQQLEGLPLIQRYGGWTAYIEGWALYTERLCDEMGLYSGDVDRLGVLSYDAWRAARLVVDTGIHAFGWSRDQAIDYMQENTLLALNNIENEVDRYIAWPGQALAYKLGQRTILDLRDEAQAALGAGFSYPAFHDVVLGDGAVPLTTLRANVRGWIRTQGGVIPVEAAAPGSGR